MTKEDYFKYYIQGSDHYLIPKDVFDELFNEMSNWREEVKELNQKYLNAVANYETTMFEKEQLNSLVNSCQEEIRRLKKQLENKYSKIGTLTNEVLYEENTKLINQQKEFIEWLTSYIELLNNKPDLIEESEIDLLKEILSKYKEIIGISNENNMEKSK